MKAEILAIGTELLLGDIVNTNAQYLSKELAGIGVEVYHQAVVGDNEQRILDEFERAFEKCDIIITSGGLGPTEDDLTKELAAKFFDKELVLHEKSLKSLDEYFKRLNKKPTENNKKQVYFPSDAVVFDNPNGTAPGAAIAGRFNDKDKVIIVLPGPPKEMEPMFENFVKPYLLEKTNSTLKSKVLRLSGIGESSMEQAIKDLIQSQTNPTIAPYAKQTDVILRITAKGKDEKECDDLIKPLEAEIRNRFGEDIYAEGETNMESVVAQMLIEKKLTVSTAESCTGGLLAGTLINYPGISEVFLEGVVTYSNEAKMKRLGVKKETLEKFGAVSSQTAEEMASGIAREAGTNVGISTTGIAGPDGGTDEKPVGLVYVGLCINGDVKSKAFNLFGSRETVRRRAVLSALDWLRRELL